MTIQMFDSVTVDAIPASAAAVAGYVGGPFRNYPSVVARFPQAMHLPVAVDAEEDAECLDVEAGDATPAEVPAWVRRQQALGVHRPVVYASVSVMPAILDLLDEAGISRSAVRLWTAHYTQAAHICGPGCGYGLRVDADATQWTDRALNGNLNESLCSDEFFGPAPPTADA